MQVVEIATRFGDTVLDVRHLATGTYRIGTARDVDLALVGSTSFPLVEWTERGCVLRIPAGAVAKRDALAVAGTIALERGDEVELAIGGVAIRVSLVERSTPVPRPRVDARWWRWAAGALAVHLLLLGVAHALATPEPPGVYVPSIASLLPRHPDPEPPSAVVRVARKRDPQQRRAAKPVQVAAVEPPASEPAPTSEPARKGRAIAGARRAGILGGIRADDLRAITGTADLDQALSEVGPIYREHEAEANRFGGGRGWDPTKDERFASVKTGRYATVSGGRAGGDHHALPGEVGKPPPPRLEHCTGACTARGGTSSDTIRTVLAKHAQTLLDCYERHARTSRGSVVVDFEIGAGGKVAHAHGDGLGPTGGCVAAVVRRIAFPATTATTTATYSMTFSP